MTKTITTLALVTATTVASILAASTAENRQLGVGDKLPAAILHTDTGATFGLGAALSEKPAVLIFYRGGWCPYCSAHLSALMDIEDDLKAAGVQLLAISPDQPSKLRDAPKRKVDPGYTLLSDQDMELSEALGIAFTVDADLVAKYKSSYGIDLEAASGRKHHKLPHPAVYVVDSKRNIRFAHVNPDYKQRLSPDEILKAARTLADN